MMVPGYKRETNLVELYTAKTYFKAFEIHSANDTIWVIYLTSCMACRNTSSRMLIRWFSKSP